MIQYKVVLCTLCFVAQSCLILCKSMDCSRQAPLSMGTLQARILEWIAMPSLPGDLPNPDIKPKSPALQADSLPSEPARKTPTSCIRFRSDQISCSVVPDSLRPHESQHARPPCPSPTPGVHSDSCPSSQ